MTPTLMQIVEKALSDGGFDGLWNEAGECACKIGDLFPCGQPSGSCHAGYAMPSDDEEHVYYISDERPDAASGATKEKP